MIIFGFEIPRFLSEETVFFPSGMTDYFFLGIK